MLEPQGMIWVWYNERDFIVWEDIDYEYIDSLPAIEPKLPKVNQSWTCWTRDYVMACTMMSSYVWLLAINWWDEDKEEKREILNEWISRWYKIGKWRWT